MTVKSEHRNLSAVFSDVSTFVFSTSGVNLRAEPRLHVWTNQRSRMLLLLLLLTK